VHDRAPGAPARRARAHLVEREVRARRHAGHHHHGGASRRAARSAHERAGRDAGRVRPVRARPRRRAGSTQVPREVPGADELAVARRDAGVLAPAPPPGGRRRHPFVAERRVPRVDAVVEHPDDDAFAHVARAPHRFVLAALQREGVVVVVVQRGCREQQLGGEHEQESDL